MRFYSRNRDIKNVRETVENGCFPHVLSLTPNLFCRSGSGSCAFCSGTACCSSRGSSSCALCSGTACRNSSGSSSRALSSCRSSCGSSSILSGIAAVYIPADDGSDDTQQDNPCDDGHNPLFLFFLLQAVTTACLFFFVSVNFLLAHCKYLPIFLSGNPMPFSIHGNCEKRLNGLKMIIQETGCRCQKVLRIWYNK